MAVPAFPSIDPEQEAESTYWPVPLADVMRTVDKQVASGDLKRLRPLETGFVPLDEVLSGGLRPTELLIVGGPAGVGKTIWGLQVARNVVRRDPDAGALYVCYEHDNTHLMSRLMCLESAELGHKGDALTLPKLAEIFKGAEASGGLMARLRQIPRYGTLVDAMGTYANRLLLTSASGDLTSINQIQNWVELTLKHGLPRLLVVVDYLQKIPIQGAGFQSEIEETTFLAHRLKEMAKSLQVAVVAIAAADRAGLKSKRMRFWDLRGSSALQYEADVGMMLNNKFTIISREHMVYNPAQAENLRGWVVMSIEKNRSGLGMVDMEYAFDPAHFRFVREGGFVRERLVDDKLVLQ